MINDEKIEVLKPGKDIPEHDCHWVKKVNFDTPEGVLEYKRICSVCGKIEKVTQTKALFDFDELHNKFHGQEE